MIEHALKIVRLALRFARVERVTRHEDGIRPETDADHTVMLTLLACEFAPTLLDRGRIAQFATVHDLVEAYAGDTQTLTIDAAGRADKDARERAAMERIRADLGTESWIVATMDAYEAQVEPEACWVKVMDKVCPKLTHLLNGCVAAKALTDLEGFRYAHARQYFDMAGKMDDLRLSRALALLVESMNASEAAWVASLKETS